MLRFVCLALLASLVSAQVKFQDCAAKEVKSVMISDCASAPCTLHKNKQVTLTVEFTANQDTQKAEIQIAAKIGELAVQVPGIDTNACKYVTCPMVKGTTYTLKYTLTIPAIAPTIEADVTAKLVGDHGVMACGTVHGSIKD